MFETHEIFDQSALDALNQLQVPGQPSFVGNLILDYLDQLDSLTETIKTNLSHGDLKGLDKYSHKLKSSSGALGLVRVAAICQAIERKARASQLAPEEVAELEKALPDARFVLKSYLEKLA